mmetsp:Transcript_2292/g.4617  ORF Transcript_2292/g.4617 Transcript_2292/m.4617 type:complete len:282 (+) Transcript_2292:157-1002(+)
MPMLAVPNLDGKHVVAQVDTELRVAHMQLCRESKSNALNMQMWGELKDVVDALGARDDVHVIVLSACGRNFCAGIDLSGVAPDLLQENTCPARTRSRLLSKIKYMQACFTAFEDCCVPVLAAVHGAAYGAAIDLITCCDIRFCTWNTKMCVKEVDVAITADIGTLQRLPPIVGHGNASELALTARVFDGIEAKRMGLVTEVFATQDTMMQHVHQVAVDIASKSPLAVQGTKATLLHARNHSGVADGLDYVATRNAALLISEDIREVLTASMQKRRPIFSKM